MKPIKNSPVWQVLAFWLAGSELISG